MSFGSSGRVSTNRTRPTGLPGSALLATTRYDPSCSRLARLQQVVDVAVAASARALRPGGVNFAPSPTTSCSRLQIRDVIFRHVVSERPHQLRHRHLGAGGHRAITGRIELQEPALAGAVLHREARRHAVALGRRDRPRACRRSVGRVRALRNLLRRSSADGRGDW